MGETTGIAWTDHTLNPWTRCTRISPGCDNCYAATWANRATHPKDADGRKLPIWGPEAPRDETKRWEESLRKWNRDAIASGVRRRVFCASLADVFEDHPSIPDERRERLLRALEETTALDVQLLTKRPWNVLPMVPVHWLDHWPAHVWIGCTVEDQERAEERVPHLLRVPAAVRFLSVEPQLEAIDLVPWIGGFGYRWLDERTGGQRIMWVIQGGESGSKARPFDLAWARSMRDQCKAAGVAYFPKQLGTRPIYPSAQQDGWKPLDLRDSHGADESEWPADLRGCRAFPVTP